ncbi:helix-turn-helix domain-containing protein [Rhodobacter sp. HX-7-19]|uniref:Helix-turn-helix domain-containing protein n=1 Tax=Paragemmobacter kunshanensis TaxID=2583234 RepID=A0A6M1U092_9RHOB|nr:helix-turn-helix domain-containing protein [Rhodobacter kunshanensis]NGQ93187.1 helix-turn-helix domain-containing protein [Rhodobacter kunshanensis]
MAHVHVTILVEQGFVPTELALVQDVLRIATRLGQGIGFDTRLCTTAGTDLVEGMGGIFVRAVPLSLDEAMRPDHLVVLGGAGIAARFEQLRARLRWSERMGQSIILMSDAASEWRLLNPEAGQITSHWEDHQVWSTALCQQGGGLALFSTSGRITTAAGMMSAADVILSQIVAPRSSWLAQAVANVLLLDRIRDGAAQQPRSENDVNALRLVKLETTIAAMEGNLEDPLSTADLAAVAGLSVRQFERKFKTFLGQSPMAFYRSLRLRRARTLIEQTALPVSEISVACGFGSPSSFSRHYANAFGVSPTRRRTQLSAKAVPFGPTSKTQGYQDAPVPFSAHTPRPSVHAAGADETPVRRIGC